MIGRFKSEFAGRDQQDSHEFVSKLLEWLHSDTNRIVRQTWQGLSTINQHFITIFKILVVDRARNLSKTIQTAEIELRLKNTGEIIQRGTSPSLSSCSVARQGPPSPTSPVRPSQSPTESSPILHCLCQRPTGGKIVYMKYDLCIVSLSQSKLERVF